MPSRDLKKEIKDLDRHMRAPMCYFVDKVSKRIASRRREMDSPVKIRRSSSKIICRATQMVLLPFMIIISFSMGICLAIVENGVCFWDSYGYF